LSLRAAVRDDTLLESGWRFQQGDVPGADKITFADTNWTAVSLPHNWGWQQAEKGEKNLRGPGWYRRDLDLGQPQPNRRYFLRFEAASSVADVYLNGKLLGEHRGAFGAFCFEITGELSPTGTNLLAVRVDNTAQPDIAPISGDFPMYGGLYRPAHLIATDATCFTPTDHASPGVAWLETSVTQTQAVLDVTAQISNGSQQSQALTWVVKLLAADGQEVAVTNIPITVAPVITAPYRARLTVKNPHLWNGRPDPFLYRAVVELRSKDGVTDAVEQPLGLRYYAVDPDKGFFLNGQPYHLHGVNRHQDRPGKGWAITAADQDEDMAIIKEMGCTVIRCAHYQHSDYFYSLCDRAGILVWAEIPQVDQINGSPQFAETSRNQLLDLIRQNVNHPAIFVWSLFNEIRPGHPDPHRELQDLKILANGEDPTRPVIAATCTGKLPEMNKIPDLLGWNIYPGWYPEWGSLASCGPQLDSYRNTSRSGGFCVSEYGAGANPTQHELPARPPITDGQWHPEEWQAIVHEEAWKQMKARPFVWGTFAWVMFDFTSYWRHEGGVPGRNDKGLVTADRQTKKDIFYFYKANWSAEPTLYLTSRRFTQRTNAVTDVKVYSNARVVKLFLNGRSQGTRTNDENSVFVWKNLTLKPGDNLAEAHAKKDGRVLSDHCVWTLTPAQ
jgi:beta-galactosidase